MITVKNYDESEYNIDEILRYSGTKGSPKQVEDLVHECVDEIKGRLSYRVCYSRFDMEDLGGEIDLSFAKTSSKDLKKNLSSCSEIILFAATIGIEVDRLIAKYNVVSPARALIFQALGAERIEDLCDRFNKEIDDLIKKEGGFTKPRFSPGYGDLPLAMQMDIFKVLECPRKIGVSLNESLLMSPSKSVTAIIGISKEPGVKSETNEIVYKSETNEVGIKSETSDAKTKINKCNSCANEGCLYRSE